MYEKNCLNYGFITHVPDARYVIVLQMHPSSQQEKKRLLTKVYSIDKNVRMYTIHAHTLHTQNHAGTRMLLQVVKGPSCVILCETHDTFVALLQLFLQTTEKKTLPFTLMGAKYLHTLYDYAAITVLAKQSLQWENVLEMTTASCFMVGSLHVYAEKCVCDSDNTVYAM